MEDGLSILVAFLLGAIPTGFIVARCYGVDILSEGSGNIGSTNVKRIIGKKAGLFTFLGDCLKGVAAVAAGGGGQLGIICGVVAILGHCFSPFLKFRGGKGVATSLAVFMIFAPWQTVASGLVFAAISKLSHYVSMGSLAAAIFLPVALFLFPTENDAGLIQIAALAVSSLIVLRHHGNIERLLRRNELAH